MTKKEQQWQLEVHQGNEWRSLDMLIARLSISKEEKEELLMGIDGYTGAIIAVERFRTEGWKFWKYWFD